VDQSAPNLVTALSDHRYIPSSKRVQIPYSVSKRGRLKVERRWAIRPKIALWPVVGRIWFNRKWIFKILPFTAHQPAKFQDDRYMCAWVIDD